MKIVKLREYPQSFDSRTNDEIKRLNNLDKIPKKDLPTWFAGLNKYDLFVFDFDCTITITPHINRLEVANVDKSVGENNVGLFKELIDTLSKAKKKGGYSKLWFSNKDHEPIFGKESNPFFNWNVITANTVVSIYDNLKWNGGSPPKGSGINKNNMLDILSKYNRINPEKKYYS